MTSSIGYDQPQDPERVEEDERQLLATVPPGSAMDLALKTALRQMIADHPNTDVARSAKAVLAGELSPGEFTRSQALAPMMSRLSDAIKRDVSQLSDEDREKLRRGEPLN